MEWGSGRGDFHGDRAHNPHEQKNRAMQIMKGRRRMIRLEMARQTKPAARKEYGSKKPV
jgi:hypothetical protein